MGGGVSKTNQSPAQTVNGGQIFLTAGTSQTASPDSPKKRRPSWFKLSSPASGPNAETLQVPAENIIKFLKDMRMKMVAQGSFTEEELRSFDTVVNRLTVDKVYEVEVSDKVAKDVDLEVMEWLKRKFSVQPSEHTPTKRAIRASSEFAEMTSPIEGNGTATPYAISPSSTMERWRKNSEIRSQKTREDIVAMFDRVDNWNFDVFTLHELTNGHTLLITGATLFIKYDLLNKFNIPESVLLSFLGKIEAGYHNNPYHNSMHAADVLQVLHYFIVKGGLIRFLSDEDILACLVAAICHDFDHPGLNNAFQVATRSPLALLYNDRAVLENHHCSSSFMLIHHNPKHDIFAKLSPEQYKDVRSMITSMILATDMGQHAKIVAKFKGRLEGGVDLTDRSDVNLALQIAIKCADVSNPARPRELYLKWAHRVCEEFYRQGDKERDLHLPISPFMDRTAPSLPKGQITFTNYIVQPLFAQFATFLPALQFTQNHIEDTKDYWTALLKQD